jgi:hypothetical protein
MGDEGAFEPGAALQGQLRSAVSVAASRRALNTRRRLVA